MKQAITSPDSALRQSLIDAIEHLEHVLPGQAPIHDFVHHNTIHGFQHLPFEQALAEFSALTGIACYLPPGKFQEFYRHGRITDTDIDTILARRLDLSEADQVFTPGTSTVTKQQLCRAALLCDLSPLTPSEWLWQVQEQGIFKREPRRLLWETLLGKLELDMPDLHPEQMLDLTSEQLADWQPAGDENMQRQADRQMQELFAEIGDSLSLRGLLKILTGVDILDSIRPQLIRVCASVLDEGQAAWQLPNRQTLGLYKAWLQCADFDIQPGFQDLRDWPNLKSSLPGDALDAIIQQLEALAIPSERWPAYLKRLALELPGWSGLINWRQTHPGYRDQREAKPELADYLAIRLILDRLHIQALSKKQWRCDGRFDKLIAYFNKHKAEFFVRHALFGGELPEYLVQASHTLLAQSSRNRQNWQMLAERIWTWQHSPLADKKGASNIYDHAWRLFKLCEALALNAPDLHIFSKDQLLNWLAVIDAFAKSDSSHVWLEAYEHHYRQDLLQALHANHDRGRWAKRVERPEAQIVFCMDDREEGIRRHLEELNPLIETLGAAGFFGVAMNYQGLDDVASTPLCPVVVTPSHHVSEQSLPDQIPQFKRHQRGGRLRRYISDLLYHGLRRDALLSVPLLHAAAPLTLGGLLIKSFFPKTQRNLLTAVGRLVEPPVATRLRFRAEGDASPATPDKPRLGFTDREQADRVTAFLRNTGLTYGFAELVVLMGHGSMSQNNPHLAAYDCGACSGRHGGPNARLFAAMANRPEVRKLLSAQGIVIPDDTWFIGAEHNTCDEDIIWYDQDDVPAERKAALIKFIEQMRHAQRMSAHERCRRLASAPRRPKPEQALRHFINRSADFSQARPELGHATNAAALVGRRSLTQGAFFDRRLFLISYDPTQDPDGNILEGILLAVGPVGAGINLEYYFSTVNNGQLGCGSKVPHNLTGFFAVMEGASSDLRTGLPQQMIEIHEAMRLQLVVEAKTSILEQIYDRQPGLRELIGGAWVHLSAKDPDSGDIFVFERGQGFVPWRAQDRNLPIRIDSPDCYRDEILPVPPMLIDQPHLDGISGR